MDEHAENTITVGNLLEAMNWAMAVIRWGGLPHRSYVFRGFSSDLNAYIFLRHIVYHLRADLANAEILEKPSLLAGVNESARSDSVKQLLLNLLERGVIGRFAPANTKSDAADDGNQRKGTELTPHS